MRSATYCSALVQAAVPGTRGPISSESTRSIAAPCGSISALPARRRSCSCESDGGETWLADAHGVKRMRDGLPEVSRQAVYDVLAALTAVGLLRRIQPSGSVARYESRVGDNHHHVVCRSCGVIADVDCAVGEAPCLTPSDHDGALDGFVLDEAEVIYWGLCPDCSASQASRSHP